LRYICRLRRPPSKLAKLSVEDQIEDVRKIFESKVSMCDSNNNPADSDKENETQNKPETRLKRTWHIHTYIEQNVYSTD